MKKHILGVVVFAMICFFVFAMICYLLNGCARPDTDETLSPQYNFAKFAGTVWKTKVEVALAKIDQGFPKYPYHLMTPSSFDSTHPDYRPVYKMEIIAKLPPGTPLRIKQLMQDHHNWGGVWVTASLDDGKVVALSNEFFPAKNPFIGREPSDSKEWSVNPDMLEKAEGM